MATYRIRHRTAYRYPSEVSASYGEVHLLPRETERQRPTSSSLAIDPPPHDLRHRTDFFGNRTGFFTVLVPHEALAVTATSEVEVARDAGAVSFPSGVPWEAAVGALAAPTGPEAVEAAGLVLDSPRIPRSPALAALAAPSFPSGRPLLEAVLDLSHRIHDDFDYQPGATDVRSSLADVLEAGAGVCQDFAHLLIGALRSLGLAARYVSGYLETQPPPGRPRLQGADRSHAWAAVWIPGAGWVDVDPTNDTLVGDRHITTAWGRDYADVSPLKGVVYTAGKSQELDVEVDVIRLDPA